MRNYFKSGIIVILHLLFTNMNYFVSNRIYFLEHGSLFYERDSPIEIIFVVARPFFLCESEESYVAFVPVVRSPVASIRMPTGSQKIAFALFENVRARKTYHQKNCRGEKKGGKHIFWLACGRLRRPMLPMLQPIKSGECQSNGIRADGNRCSLL